jgi:hypothetical protein
MSRRFPRRWSSRCSRPGHRTSSSKAHGGREPTVPSRGYADLYGNPCVRAVLPTGRSSFRYRAVAVQRRRRQPGRARGLPRLHPPCDLVLPGAEHPGPVRLRVPARHGCPSRPGPDGLRGLDGGLAGRPVVDLRPPQQRQAQGPGRHRPGPRRLRRGDGHDASDVAMATTFGSPRLESMTVQAEEATA